MVRARLPRRRRAAAEPRDEGPPLHAPHRLPARLQCRAGVLLGERAQVPEQKFAGGAVRARVADHLGTPVAGCSRTVCKDPFLQWEGVWFERLEGGRSHATPPSAAHQPVQPMATWPGVCRRVRLIFNVAVRGQFGPGARGGKPAEPTCMLEQGPRMEAALRRLSWALVGAMVGASIGEASSYSQRTTCAYDEH